MSISYKTPGVYIDEINAFPNSVVPVATSIPAFTGYTQKTEYNGTSLLNKPVEIHSMREYMEYFGGAPDYKLAMTSDATQLPGAPFIHSNVQLNGTGYTVFSQSPVYYLYNSIRLFFQNGGGECYIVSVGGYSDNGPQKTEILNGLQTLKNITGPTIILVPDSLRISGNGYGDICTAMLEQCNELSDRVALFDVYNGFITNSADMTIAIDDTRTYMGINGLSYGATYFPWMNTNIIQSSEINITNIAIPSVDALFADMLEQDTSVQKQKTNITTAVTNYTKAVTSGVATEIQTTYQQLQAADMALQTASKNYAAIKGAMLHVVNTLPVSPAMAGIYTMIDNTRGVWKAPANVSLSSVISPAINISNEMQEGLNIDTVAGKSINAIRAFSGMGILVWGARTLDGNSNDYRYINVRRTLIYIEQSVKMAMQAYVFSPNDANTWISVKSMTENFLTNLWRDGALVGAKPTEAFSVQVGLGSTMTAQDILDGIMRMNIMVSLVHPAEFIVITLEQMQQTS